MWESAFSGRLSVPPVLIWSTLVRSGHLFSPELLQCFCVWRIIGWTSTMPLHSTLPKSSNEIMRWIYLNYSQIFRKLQLQDNTPNINKKTTQKPPWTWHCPNKATILTLPAVSAFWCLYLSFLHPQKSSKRQENLQALWAHTGYWGSCSSPAWLGQRYRQYCTSFWSPALMWLLSNEVFCYQDTLQICSLRQKLQPGKAELASLSV